jgi:hypothetical protein
VLGREARLVVLLGLGCSLNESVWNHHGPHLFSMRIFFKSAKAKAVLNSSVYEMH